MNHNFFSYENNATFESFKNKYVPYVPFGLKSPGYVTKVNFSKVDSPGLREARFFNSNQSGLTLLSNVYDASIDMHGVFDFYPGGLCFLDPVDMTTSMGVQRGFSDSMPIIEDGSIAWHTGIGGYQIITKVSIDFSVAKTITATQNVSCKWVYAGIESEIRRVKGNQNIQQPPVTEECFNASLEFRGERVDEANTGVVGGNQEARRIQEEREAEAERHRAEMAAARARALNR